MKKLIFLLVILLILPSVLAIDLDVKVVNFEEVLVMEVDQEIVANIEVTNLGNSDFFEFYNFVGFEFSPREKIYIEKDQTKDIELRVSPIGNFEHRGFYTFQYFVQDSNKDKIEQELTFKVIELRDAFEIGSGELYPESNSFNVYIYNKENFNFENLKVSFDSAFFNLEEEVDLGFRERKDFNVELNKEEFNKLTAGFYTLHAKVISGNVNAEVEGDIKFVGQDILKISEDKRGFIIYKNIITKVNEGNTIVESQSVLTKNILSRLFTTFNIEPDFVERKGFFVTYTWVNKVKPGETLEIIVKTNWLFPFLIIFLIVAIVVFVKRHNETYLILRKKVSFVHTRGGEFALKISTIVNAKKYVERVNIVDRLPPLVKIHERFGGEPPSRIDEKNRRLEWNFDKLEAGEMRVLSYVIYSKIGVVGKFVLPPSTAIYEKEGKIEEAESNRAFFVAEPKSKREVDLE